jgi:hypothetical protein
MPAYKEVSDIIKKLKENKAPRHRQYTSRNNQVWRIHIKT